jgi:hypothetical protein
MIYSISNQVLDSKMRVIGKVFVHKSLGSKELGEEGREKTTLDIYPQWYFHSYGRQLLRECIECVN